MNIKVKVNMKAMKILNSRTLTLLFLAVVYFNILPILGVALYYENPVKFSEYTVWQMYWTGWMFNIVISLFVIVIYMIPKFRGKDGSYMAVFLDTIFILVSIAISFIIVNFMVNGSW